jgi:hypothetical protein
VEPINDNPLAAGPGLRIWVPFFQSDFIDIVDKLFVRREELRRKNYLLAILIVVLADLICENNFTSQSFTAKNNSQ